MIKKYIQAPLPFQGQKRNFLKQFNEIINKLDDSYTYVDLFGGSGLLSHSVKHQKPNARVIYNDFDNYSERLKNIPKTNMLLSKLREVIGTANKEKINIEDKESIINILEQEEYLDCITLSANLLFSGKYATSLEQLKKESYYNRIRKSDYCADGYLEGVEIVQSDYKLLFEQYKDLDKVIFLVDPPYLSTDCSSYTNYWKLRDYLDVLNVLEGNYIYFTSEKSSIIELCDWIETRTYIGNPFTGSTMTSTSVSVNKSAGYRDIMLYKFKKAE